MYYACRDKWDVEKEEQKNCCYKLSSLSHAMRDTCCIPA